MNKGRNLAILMVCLLCLSVLTYLTHTESANRTAVVDRVRYIRTATEGSTMTYEFYFVGPRVMEGRLTSDIDGQRHLEIWERIPLPEDQVTEDMAKEDTYTLQPYGYVYTVTGTSRHNAAVTWSYREGVTSFEEEPFERFSVRMLTAMVFGAAPLLSIPQAILVGAIAAGGGLIIGYAEELWHFTKKKGPEEDPKWEELAVYKRVGGGVIAFAALLLIVLVIL